MNTSYQLSTSKMSYVSSPISITMLLTLLCNGTTGDTLKELLKTFNVTEENYEQKIGELIEIQKEINETKVSKLSNVVLSRPTLSKNYLNKIKNYSTCEQINDDVISLTKKINDLIKTDTNNLISKVVKESEIENAICVLINTMYFKDQWSTTFKSENTFEGLFRTKTLSKPVKYMFSNNTQRYYECDMYQHVELKYKTANFYFGIVLPKDTNSDAFVLPSNEILDNLSKLNNCVVRLTIPKFKQDTEIDMIPILREMGINKLFDNPEIEMFDENINSFLSIVKHMASISIDENGTEAAAVTVAMMMKCARSNPQTEYCVEATHPFSYYIRYKDIFLFVGVHA